MVLLTWLNQSALGRYTTLMVTRKSSFPAGIIIRTFILLLVTLAGTAIYDLYWKNTNVYITAVSNRLESFETDGRRPLVVLIGTSQEMLSTSRTWRNDEFDWLRLIIQGSRIREFTPVVDEIIAFDPDLVVLGMSLFGPDPYLEQTRAAFKRMLRAPLEATGVMSRTFRHDNDSCGAGVYTVDEALARTDAIYLNPRNELASSSVVSDILSAGISLVILRTPLQRGIEEESLVLENWIGIFSQDARELEIPFIEHDDSLDGQYFCPDNFHMNNRGQRLYQAWLKRELLAQLGVNP